MEPILSVLQIMIWEKQISNSLQVCEKYNEFCERNTLGRPGAHGFPDVIHCSRSTLSPDSLSRRIHDPFCKHQGNKISSAFCNSKHFKLEFSTFSRLKVSFTCQTDEIKHYK